MTISAAKPERFELIANVSMLYREIDYLDRFEAAAGAGFQGVETWWPFRSAVPDEHDLADFLRVVDESGIPLVGLNLFAGDMAIGERGLLSRPDRQEELAANLEVIVEIARVTGCRLFNALYGQRLSGITAHAQNSLAIANLGHAAKRLGDVGGTVLIEPLTAGTAGTYPIHTAADAVAIVELTRERSGSDNVGALFDTHHLANNGDDLLDVVSRFAEHIAHVQIADAPGRAEPGSGTLPIPAVIERLWGVGYRGAVACEYMPSGATGQGLAWIAGVPRLRLGTIDSH